MENEMLVRTGTGIQPWQAMEMNCGINPMPDCFYTPSWDASLDHTHGVQLDTGLGSIVSSPAASNSNNASENANVTGNSSTSLGQISPHTSHRLLPSPGFNSANTSLYSTPLSSLPNVSFPMVVGLNSSVAEFSADPGFAERAARFSCYGSRCRSFNGRSSHQMGSIGNLESPYVMNSPTRISRVLSSPSLKALGAGSHVTAQQTRNHNLQKPGDRPEVASSLEESSVSDQKDNGPKSLTYVNSRKRKAAQKGKAKESAGAAKVAEDKEDSNAKRCKPNGGNGNGNGPSKAEEDDKKGKNDGKKPAEPPKDYIHVRARRGQATDSHSLAERVRREKISERMKLLQDLVPGCNKVVGKALMLDEIINYVRSLQRQVESLSMKLASVNTSMDFSMDDALMSNKDTFQSINSMPNPQMYPLDSSAFHGQNISDGTVSHCSVDPLGMGTTRSLDAHLTTLNDLQYQSFCGGDLQTIVQMGFAQSSQQDSAYPLHPLHGSMQASQMKVEL